MASEYLLAQIFAFVLGAIVGSFLNVCIYRLPRDLSVNKPRRSFCPSCKKEIPWYQNIPLVSWIVLRGRCANCGTRIPFRYFLVELLTALLFLAVWNSFPWQVAIAYWIFVALLIVATFVDFEHFIIPDEITLGGIAAGLIASLAVPELMATNSRLTAIGLSALSAALGYGILWLVLEGGKMVFGKKNIRLAEPTAFSWTRTGDDADFVVGEERGLWSDYFAREKDLLLLHCNDATIDGRALGNVTLQCHYDRVTIGDETLLLDKIDRITGTVRELQIPARSDGPRRSEISRRDRRVSRLARRSIFDFRRIAARIACWPNDSGNRQTRLVGEAALWALSRRRRVDLDVFRRRAYRQIFFDAQPLTSRVSSPELDRADDVHGRSGKASPRQT